MNTKNITFKDSTFDQNLASVLSKNFFVGFSNISIDSCFFSDSLIPKDYANSLQTQGSFIHLIMGVEMIIADSTFMNGYSSMGGAIFMSGSSTLNIKSSQFLNNYASNSGGAMYFRGLKQVKISEQTKFRGNQAKISGGDICAIESERNMTLQDVTIENMQSLNSINMESMQFLARRLSIKSK